MLDAKSGNVSNARRRFYLGFGLQVRRTVMVEFQDFLPRNICSVR